MREIDPFILEAENPRKYLETILQNPREAKELIKLLQIPLYNLKFDINSLNDSGAVKLIEKFGINNFQYLQERINKFDKRWIALNDGNFKEYSAFTMGGKKNKLLLELSDLIKTYEFEIGLTNLLDMKGEYNKKVFREGSPTELRINIPFKGKTLNIDTVTDSVILF